MLKEIKNGTIRIIDGQERIFYDNHWIKHYNVPNSLAFKKNLIDMLTRRVFRHTEPGINTPGSRLEEVREAYNEETDPSRKRVLAAMLAGSLLNRGSEILTKVVELEEIGVTVKSNNELLRECGRCFMGALEYGKYIRPLHGNEELDEVWGEPFKAFTMPVDQFLETRYIKMAHTMSDMDILTDALKDLFIDLDMFPAIPDMIEELAISAKLVIETQKSDADIINVWPRMIGAADELNAFEPVIPEGAPQRIRTMGKRGKQLIDEGTELVVDLANIRVPRPKSTEIFLERAHAYSKRYIARMRNIA
jgi:hypothetical protein